VLEEDDAYGELDDYADNEDTRAKRSLLLGYHQEVVSSDEDAIDTVLRAPGLARLVGQSSQDVGLLQARPGNMGNDSFIAGFVRGDVGREGGVSGVHSLPQKTARLPVPRHVFKRASSHWYGALRDVDHTEVLSQVEAPRDGKLRSRIDMMAAMVARGGDGVLKLAQQTHAGVFSPA
jgi:hypothetical protein